MHNNYLPSFTHLFNRRAILTICSLMVLLTINTNAATPSTGTNVSDWDKDGLSDKTEEMIGSGVYLSDTDGDGIQDKLEVGNIKKPLDTDKDGRIDVLDIDDDGDGIPTVIEGYLDTDEDGKPDYLDTDSDADGLADTFEVRLTGNDADNDKLDDLFDVDVTKGQDANGDGVDDSVVLVDSNKNGTPDLLDNKSSLPHINKQDKKNNGNKRIPTAVTSSHHDKSVNKVSADKPDTRKLEKPVVVSAAKLPAQMVSPKPKIHSYMESNNVASKTGKAYGGSGYFYCANTGKIVPGIKGFMMTPPGKVKVQRDASEGEYQWRTNEPGTYALQFQIPKGMSIVRGLAKGRRIVKQGDTNPLILGGGENVSKKGYLAKAPGDVVWYTSFEIKDDAPMVLNNNIPLSGDFCK